MSETANIRISSAVHARTRIAAAIRGVTIKDLVEDAITEKLARIRPAEGQLEAGYDLLAEVPHG